MKEVEKKAANAAVQTRSAVRNAITLFFFAICANPAFAQLSRPREVIDLITQEIHYIIPGLATLVLICLFIAYSMKMCRKETFINWGIGIVGAGMAGTLVAMLYG